MAASGRETHAASAAHNANTTTPSAPRKINDLSTTTLSVDHHMMLLTDISARMQISCHIAGFARKSSVCLLYTSDAADE